MPVKKMCELLGIPRSSFYHRAKQAPAPPDDSDELIEDMRRLRKTFKGYGYRRMTHELKNLGHEINHKRVLRLMRKSGLLIRPKRRFVVTTDSRHNELVYPNRAKAIEPNRINELWVADITYITLDRGYAYLAAILDVFSRKVVGFSLKKTMGRELTLAALRMALVMRTIQPGLTHHSDRGVQYACHDYVDLLKQHAIAISMSRIGNPYDNAYAESFMGTLKKEEVYLTQYRDFNDARVRIGRFIEDVYNAKRLHSSLGYLSPVEFERTETVTSVS